MNISFNELRKIKHQLPQGSMKIIAERLNISEDTVRNYFGGSHYKNGEGNTTGFHIESGPDGGVVSLDDTTILDMARELLETQQQPS
jgi:hypothetical protein